MSKDLRNSVAELLSEVNRDEMWEKFFASVEYNSNFEEILKNYKNLKDEIIDLEDDISEIILQDWFEARNKINAELVALEKEQADIKKVLDVYDDSLSNVQKRIYEDRLKKIPAEINQVKAKHFKLSEFKKQKEAHEALIKEKQGYLDTWYKDLENNFGTIKEKMVFKVEEYNRNLDKEYDHLNLKLENVKKNLKYAEVKEEEMKKFGESSSQFKEASEAKHNAMTAVINVEKEIKEFENNLAKMNVETIKFIHFLKNVSFEEFFERLEKNKFSLDFGKGESKDGEDKPIVVPMPEGDKPEQTGGNNGEVENPVPEEKPQEVGVDKLPRGNGDSTGAGEDDKENNKTERNKENITGKKKVKGKRDIPESVFDKIKNIVPAMKKFFSKFGKRSVKEQSNLVTTVSENEYVANDKLLLGVISANITDTFGAKRDDSKSKDYFNTYSKIMKLKEEDVQKIFNDIPNKEEVLSNIGAYCDLSDEEYVALLNKVNGEVVNQKSR